MLSSAHDSPFILVLCISRCSRNSDPGPLNRGGVWKCRNFRPITCYISETVEDMMGIYSEAFYKHWILFTTVWHLPRLSQGRTQRRPKCAKNVLKWPWRTFKHTAWITGKRLKIGYMLRGVWQALNFLSIHVTFTAKVPGAYPGEAKMSNNVLKWRTFKLSAWITRKWLKRWVHAERLLTSIEFSLDPCKIYRDCPRGVHRGGQNVS